MPRGVPSSGVRRPRKKAQPAVPKPTVAKSDGADSTPAVPAASETQAPLEAPRLATEPGELSTEQLEIKRLRDELAREKGKKDVEVEPEPLASPGDEGNILIHFLEDGLTALGRVFYRGEELEFDPNSQAYRDTFDRNGVTWLDLRNDEFEQANRWGRIMFRKGPWPGKSYLDGAGTFQTLRSERKDGGMVSPPTPEELERADKARKRRAAPHLAPI